MMMDALALPNFDPAMTAAPAADVGDWAGTYVPRVSGIRLERYTDLLNEWISFRAGAERAVLRSGGGGARTFSYAGGHRLRAAGRVLPSHVLLLDASGHRMISDGLRTYTRIGAWQIWLLWTSLAAGLLGLAYVALFLPILAWRRRGFLVQPASIAPLLLFAGAGLMALQPFEQLGDRTAGSFLLLMASITLPIGAVVQAALALRRRYRWWSWDVAAGAVLLQWSVVLGLMEVLPLRLWW